MLEWYQGFISAKKFFNTYIHTVDTKNAESSNIRNSIYLQNNHEDVKKNSAWGSTKPLNHQAESTQHPLPVQSLSILA